MRQRGVMQRPWGRSMPEPQGPVWLEWEGKRDVFRRAAGPDPEGLVATLSYPTDGFLLKAPHRTRHSPRPLPPTCS